MGVSENPVHRKLSFQEDLFSAVREYSRVTRHLAICFFEQARVLSIATATPARFSSWFPL